MQLIIKAIASGKYRAMPLSKMTLFSQKKETFHNYSQNLYWKGTEASCQENTPSFWFKKREILPATLINMQWSLNGCQRIYSSTVNSQKTQTRT